MKRPFPKEIKEELKKIIKEKPMKQVILVRQDLDMGKGKIGAQCAHAAVEAEMLSSRSKVEEWLNEGAKKVVLKVKDLRELKEYEKEAKKEKLVVATIIDRGLTEVKPSTVTCMAIGPDEENKIDKVTKDLKLL